MTVPISIKTRAPIDVTPDPCSLAFEAHLSQASELAALSPHVCEAPVLNCPVQTRPVLEARDLTKSYGSRPVLSRATIAVARGELVAVLGPSGSGKTTLFRCLAGLVEPDAGIICYDGQKRASASVWGARPPSIGVVFQQFNLIRRLDALDNVLTARLATTSLTRVLFRHFTKADRELALSALADVGLADHANQRAETLSGGQQQRVAIARALAQQSPVLLADEPVASLDPKTAGEIMALLRRLSSEKGLAILCTLHQPELAARWADRVMTMDQGRLQSADLRPAAVTPLHPA